MLSSLLCNCHDGGIKSIHFFKRPSRYMIKKYGYDEAFCRTNGNIFKSYVKNAKKRNAKREAI